MNNGARAPVESEGRGRGASRRPFSNLIQPHAHTHTRHTGGFYEINFPLGGGAFFSPAYTSKLLYLEPLPRAGIGLAARRISFTTGGDGMGSLILKNRSGENLF